MTRNVFITGGASGLGLALATQYLAAGWQVAIGDHNREALAAVASGPLANALALECDVTVETDLEAARDTLLAAWGRIDLVINNAGVAVAGPVADCPSADWDWIVGINLLGVARGCRIFAPVLIRQGHGHIVNISSMAALLFPPSMAAYCATKAAVVALSEVLEVELANSGVSVSVVCPAFFRTGLADHSRTTSPELKGTVERLVGKAPVDADTIARRVRSGIAARRFLITTHRSETLAWHVKRILPHAWFHRLMMVALRRAR